MWVETMTCTNSTAITCTAAILSETENSWQTIKDLELVQAYATHPSFTPGQPSITVNTVLAHLLLVVDSWAAY